LRECVQISHEYGVRPFKNWNDERAKGLAVIEESYVTFKALLDATNELAAARRISYTEAAEQVQGYYKDEHEQVDRATKAFDAQALIERNLIATSDPATAEEKKQRADAIRASDERRRSPATGGERCLRCQPGKVRHHDSGRRAERTISRYGKSKSIVNF
jgi:hypothetical protein